MVELEKLAKEIASKADECCYRGGEWEEEGIRVLALQKLKKVYNEAIEETAKLEMFQDGWISEEIRNLKK